MKFRIPYLSDRAQAQPLKDVIDFTAESTGLDTRKIAVVLSYLLEGISTQVSVGRTVRLPGFGLFAADLDERRQYLKHRAGPVCLPKFSAAKGFRAQVMSSAPMSRKGKKDISNHRRTHSTSPYRYTTRRVWKSMEDFRNDIARQLGEEVG